MNLIYPEGYKIEGPAALVETAVQNALNDDGCIDKELHNLKETLADTRLSRVPEVDRYEKARFFKQATVALGSFAVFQDAFPRMGEWHARHGTLLREDVDPDPVEVAKVWISDSKARVVAGLESRRHPLLEHLKKAGQEACDAAL